jgi:3-oxoacyl-[acyl-carrier-protein] synthase-3
MCVPPQTLTNEALAQRVDTNDEWIVTRTGIRERRVTDAQTASSDLALVAARQALEDAQLDPADLDLVLCATATGDYIWPATSCILQDALGATRAAAFDLSAACSGFCYGLATAAGFIQSGIMERILVVGVDTLTKHLNWEDRGTCILFGDGAGAAVLTPCAPHEGVIASALHADGGGLKSVWLPAGGTRTPTTPETLATGQNCLQMQGKEVYRFAVEAVPQVIQEVLDKACLRPEEIDLLVMHQANIRILQAAADRFGISMDKVPVNVDRYGNTSAASIPIALREAADQGRLRRGDVVVTVGFGAGLTWGANVLRWNRDR